MQSQKQDIAVAIGQEIQFFSKEGNLTDNRKFKDDQVLAGLAYDNTTGIMYISDKESSTAVFSDDLTNTNSSSETVFKKTNNSHILGIAFDAKTQTLFWSDAMHQAIMSMRVPVNGTPEAPSLLHDLTTRDPRGIAVDTCNRHLYWVNSNSTNSSIERSNLDGTNRTIVINKHVYEPLAVAIDYAEGKLYWVDDVEGVEVEIGRSNLNGSDGQKLVSFRRQQPFYLAVDDRSIYWTDRLSKTVWKMPKLKDANTTTTLFKSYYSSHSDDPAGIVTRDNVNCSATAKTSEKPNDQGVKTKAKTKNPTGQATSNHKKRRERGPKVTKRGCEGEPKHQTDCLSTGNLTPKA